MTPSIGHPGIFLNEYSLSVQGHLDKPELLMMGKRSAPTDFGVLDLWAYKRTEEVPFMALNLPNGVTTINGDSYTFTVPTAADKSLKVVKDLTGSNARVGFGGQPFDILVNRYIGAGARVKLDVTHQLELQALDNSIAVGEHHKVTFRLVPNAANIEYVPKNFLQPGSHLVVLAHTINSEFGQKFATWEAKGSSRKKFINKVTTAEIQTSYHITREAGKLANGISLNAEEIQAYKDLVVEYVQVPGVADNGITWLSDYLNSGAPGFTKLGYRGLVSLFDDISLGVLAKEAYNYQLWGSGGSNLQDGFDVQQFAPGVYFQLDFSGYKHFYSIDTFDLSILKGAVRDYFKDKVPRVVEGGEPLIEIRTGSGGFELLSNAFEQRANQQNVVTSVNDFGGYVTGSVIRGLIVNDPIYVGYRITGVALFKVVKDYSLDRREANNFINPIMPSGYRLSSYSMMIQEPDTSGSNMKILRPIDYGGGEVRMNVQNGRHMSHPLFESQMNGNVTVTQSADYRTGFEATFTTVPDTVIVMDPTRVLKLVPKNPNIPGYGF